MKPKIFFKPAVACFLFFLPGFLHAQFTYSIITSPDSAEVFVNGNFEGKTPCKVEFNWREVPDSGMNFLIQLEGYKEQRFSVKEMPSKWRQEITYTLEKDYVHFSLDANSPVVGFDKLLFEFTQGRIVGQKCYASSRTDLTWDAFMRVGDGEFEVKAYDNLGSAGFNTPMKESGQLFSGAEKKIRPPRFIVGGRVLDLWVEDWSQSYSKVSRLRLEIEWQVLDKSSGKVVLTSTSKGEWRANIYGQTARLLFLGAFDEAIQAFLREGKLFDLVKTNEAVNPLSGEEEIREARTIAITLNPSFSTQSEMIQYATKACVTISTDAGHGSGFFIDKNGLILTAYHVVQGTNRIEAILSFGVKMEAKLISFDEKHDMALLSISGSGYTPLQIGESAFATPGVDVFTIGTPADLELGQSVSKGIVSGKRKFEDIIYIQTDVSVSPGNSGGPLLNNKGEIIGIIQGKIIGGGVEGIGFALPIEEGLKQLNIKKE